jgi:hypothetical protein
MANHYQAMNALVFLNKQVLEVPLNKSIDAVRAERGPRTKVKTALLWSESHFIFV